jgi:chromosomal replication initiation ATPase DnaA
MINIPDIISQTEIVYHLKPGTLRRKRRSKTIAEARSVAIYLSHLLTQWGQGEIADLFNRDESTVRYNCKKIVNMIDRSCNNNTYCTIISYINSIIDTLEGASNGQETICSSAQRCHRNSYKKIQ